MSKQQNYGAVGVEQDLSETAPSHDDDHESISIGRPLTWITGIGALVTFVLLLTKSNHTTPFLMGSSLPPEDRARFYNDQPVDHFDDENGDTWSNRYYKSTKYFKGAGHPIFMIVGGEGALDHGMLYPFVTEYLAKKFGAAVLQIEHRFYGPFQPVTNATSDQLLELLTPAQAMADMVQLTRHIRDFVFVGCSPNRNSPDYCPIVTVGASYPGALSALFRIVHGDFVDISYASSAPLLMYAQISDPNSYYDIVTSAGDRVSPGCSKAVRNTFDDMVDRVHSSSTLKEAAKSIGVCPDSIPKYITTKKKLSDAIVEIASYAYADYDMSNYPPGPNTGFSKACKLFQNDQLNTKDTLSLFFERMLLQEEEDDEDCDMTTVECNFSVHDFDEKCFDLMTQLPDGPGSTLEDTGGDYEVSGRLFAGITPCLCGYYSLPLRLFYRPCLGVSRSSSNRHWLFTLLTLIGWQNVGLSDLHRRHFLGWLFSNQSLSAAQCNTVAPHQALPRTFWRHTASHGNGGYMGLCQQAQDNVTHSLCQWHARHVGWWIRPVERFRYGRCDQP